MQFKPHNHFRPFTALLISLWVLPGWAQDGSTPKKYLLKEGPDVKGNVSVVDQGSSVKIEVFGTARGADQAFPRTIVLVHTDREKGKETVLAHDKSGPTYVRRVYTHARVHENSGGKPPKTVIQAREGKTVTLKRVGDKVLVSVPKGKLPAAEVKTLQEGFLPSGHLKFFSDREVGPGDEWTLDTAELARSFHAERATLKARFLDVVPFQGHSCARIALNLQMETKFGKNPVTWDMQGDLHFALDLEHTLSVKLAGPVSLKGTVQNGDVTVDVDGLGTGEFTHTQKWLKINGKMLPEQS